MTSLGLLDRPPYFDGIHYDATLRPGGGGRCYVKPKGAGAKVGVLTDFFTFTGGNLSYYRGANGLLIPSATNTPRIEYDAAGNVLGLLVEGARTNLGLHSNDGTNAAWTKSDCTAAKTATGPDGVANSATTLTATDANATCLQAVTSSSAARAYSAWLRRRTGTGNIDMTLDNGSTWTTKTLTTTWTRFDIAQTLANPTFGFRIVTSGDAIDFYGSQLESAAFPSSLIPTTTGSVARAADVVSRTFGSEVSQARGTLYAEFDFNSIDTSSQQNICALDDGTSNELVRIAQVSNGLGYTVLDGGAVQANVSHGAPAAGTKYKIAMVYAANDFISALGGSLSSADTSGTLPTTTTLHIGRRGGGPLELYGHIRRLSYFPERKGNLFLQRVTQLGLKAA